MSSVVYIGVGQCGNQILESFINHELNSNRNSYKYLESQNEKLRCIFVDSESKVINNIKTKSKFKKSLREENLIYSLNGRGSNWCYGYNGCASAPNMSDNVLEKIRKEVERCDNYIGLVMCQSIGGGTGSGFGSKLTELIRDELQLQQILNCSVAPSDVGGDSPVQYYNCLLSLATLNRYSDGMLLFHNDSLLNQTGLDFDSPIKTATRDYKSNILLQPDVKRNSTPHYYNRVSLATVNNLIGTQMGSLLSPCSSIYPDRSDGPSLNLELNEFLRSLCSFPDSKIVRSVSSTTGTDLDHDWANVTKSTLRQLRSGFGCVYDTISAVICSRGSTGSRSHLPALVKLRQQMGEKMHVVPWNREDAVDTWIDRNPNEPDQITLAFNSGCVVNYLRHIQSQCEQKFRCSAYLHWYYRFGGTKELFQESFAELERIISSYDEITS